MARLRRVRPLATFRYFVRGAIPGLRVFANSVPGSRLRFYGKAPDLVSRHIAKYGAYEPDLTAWLARFLAEQTEAKLIVDVGANIGWHSVNAALSPQVSQVIACEPDAFNMWLLERNLAVNGIEKVHVAPWAIGERSGHASLFRYKASNLSRHSMVVDHGFGRRSVPIMSLDETLALFGLDGMPIHVIKIDVEGYEFAVLAGAKRALGLATAVVLEFSPDLLREAGRTPSDVLDPMRDAKFVPFMLTRDGHLREPGPGRLEDETRQINLVWPRQGGGAG